MLQRRKFFQGREIRGEKVKDISWIAPSGHEMDDQDWAQFVRCLGVRLDGQLIYELDEQGRHISGETLFIMFNAHYEPIEFHVPKCRNGYRWGCVFDTAQPKLWMQRGPTVSPYRLKDRATVVLIEEPLSGGGAYL